MKNSNTAGALQQSVLMPSKPCLAASEDADGIATRARVEELQVLMPKRMAQEKVLPQAFPFDALGFILGGTARRLYEVVKAPDSICGQSLLATAALMVQGYADVHIDGRVYPLSLFCLTVAESGDRKSAIDKEVLLPVRKYQEMLVKDFFNKRQVFKNKLDAWKKKRQDLIASKQGKDFELALKDSGNEPIPPLEPYVLLEEPTMEGLFKLFAVGQPSVGLFSDEGAKMIGGHAMSAEHLMATAGGLSTLWDGSPISRIRANREENLILYGKRLSMHLMIQENIFAKVQHHELLQGQGLLARCLTVSPPSNAGSRYYKAVDLQQDFWLQQYHQRANEILDHPFPLSNSIELNALTPRALSLDAAAKEQWVLFHDEIESNLGHGGLLHGIKRVASKIPEQALRIAGVLALFEDMDVVCITVEVLDRAITLARYYIAEALRIEELGWLDPHVAVAQKLLDWMQRKAQNDGLYSFTLSAIYQGGPREVRKRDAAMKAVHLLVEQGRLIPVLEQPLTWRFCSHG